MPTTDDFNDYDGFVDKFKPKKTTDDCYTPENIYDVVADFVVNRYGVSRDLFVRPFYPGGDYEHFDYSGGKIVVDNPPFSIFSQIVAFYKRRGIRFFLFCNGLTALNGARNAGATVICTGTQITYENKAKVNTSFCTNMEPGRIAAMSCPELHDALKRANDANEKAATKTVAKLAFPDHIVTAAKINWYSVHHTQFAVKEDNCLLVSSVGGVDIFGGGLLLSDQAAAEKAAAEKAAAEKAAAEKAAAEKAAAEKVRLSDDDRLLVKWLSEGGKLKPQPEQIQFFEEDEQ